MELRTGNADDSSQSVEISYGNVTKMIPRNSVEDEIRVAQQHLCGDGKGLINSQIRLHIVAPEMPNLTLVDLPGIVNSRTDDQPADIVQVSNRIIEEYVQKTNSLILCVLPANQEAATTSPIQKVRAFDPQLDRAIGVVTKADLACDNEGQRRVIRTINNREIELKNGFIVVKLRPMEETSAKGDVSYKGMVKDELNFFANHPIFKYFIFTCFSMCTLRKIPAKQRGIASLAMYLSKKLAQFIIVILF